MEKQLENLVSADEAKYNSTCHAEKHKDMEQLAIQKKRAKAVKYWNKKIQPKIIGASNNGEHDIVLHTPIFQNINEIERLAHDLGYSFWYKFMSNDFVISWW